MTPKDEDLDSPRIPPPEGGLGAQVMRENIAANLFGTGGSRGSVGRFEIQEELGSGGMGVVYSAIDPHLDRIVALKLLPDESVGDERQRDRLLKEAKALAKLSHPNVVAIHESGEYEGGVFIVMERVEGLALDSWQREGQRSLADILEVFVQAADGLTAAHAAGVVHHDFKPSNVLVGNDGRVRVADFGVARVFAAPLDSSAGETTSGAPADRTRSAVLGTPAYMSPEQATGQPTDAASDQFSFCVALWESVFGVRPWGPAEIRALAIDPTVCPPPAHRKNGPKWLRRVLLRGLAGGPRDRWASMAELRAALRSHDKRGRRALLGVGLVALAILVAPLWTATDRPCADPSPSLAGIWDGTREAALRERLGAGAPAFAAEALPSIRGRLDGYAATWTAARSDACEATFVRAEQSEEQFDRSIACLERARYALGSAVDALVDASPEAIAAADAVLDQLPSIAACRDLRVLRDGAAPPDPDVAAGVQELQHRIDRANVLLVAGRVNEAIALGSAARDDAAKLGHEATLAEATLVLGEAYGAVGRIGEGRTLLFSAATTAMGARSPEVAVRAWHRLVRLAVTDLEQPQQAREWAELARTAIHLSAASPLLEARQLDFEGLVATAEADHARAVDLHRRAAEQLASLLSHDDLHVMQIERRAANALLRSGELDEAERIYLSIEKRVRDRFGDRHPEFAQIAHSLALLSLVRGNDADAQRRFRTSLDVLSEAFGPRSLRVAPALTSLGQIAVRAGDLDTAADFAARAWDVQRTARPIGHSERASALALLADVNLQRRAHEKALAQYRELTVELEVGAHADRLAEVHQNIGWLLCELGRCVEGREAFERAKELAPGDGPLAAYLDVLAARIEIAEGKAGEAIARLETLSPRAEAIPSEQDPELVPELRWVLGQALIARDQVGDCERARSNLSLARAGYQATGARPEAPPELERLEASLRCAISPR